MTVAFDVDYTLIGEHDEPLYDNIDLLRWFARHGHRIIVWSGGGKDYATMWARRLGLLDVVHATESKGKEASKKWKPDICFDDCMVELATVNCQIIHPTSKNDPPEKW